MILPAILSLVLGLGAQDPAAGWFTVTAADTDVSAAAVERVRSTAAAAIATLRTTFPELPRERFRIVLHDRREAMPMGLRAAHHEGSPGFALLARHEIHLVHREVAGSGQGFWPVVLHELTHEFLHQFSGGQHLPRWFHEGFAQVVAQDTYLGGREEQIVWRVPNRQLLPFGELDEDFPRDPNGLVLAYAQSHSYVAWLEREYGRDTLLDAVRRVGPDCSFLRGLVLETGRTTSELVDGWHDYLLHGSGASWRTLLGQCFALTMVLALPLLALALIRRLQADRMARERLERAETAEGGGDPGGDPGEDDGDEAGGEPGTAGGGPR